MKVSPSRLTSMWWQLPAWCYTDSDKRKAHIPTHEAKGWDYWNLLPRARDSLLGQVFGPSSPRIWLMHKTLPFIQGWCSILQKVSSVPSPPRKWWHHRPSIPICGVMDSSLKKPPLHQIVIRRKGKTIFYLISTSIAEPILRAKCRALTNFISQQDGARTYVLFPVDHNSTRHPNHEHEKRSQGHPNTRYLPPALSAADTRHFV